MWAMAVQKGSPNRYAIRLPTAQVSTLGGKAQQLLHRLANPLCRVLESLIPPPPADDRFAVLRQYFELRERSERPVHGPQDHRDHARRPLFVALHRPFHLHVLTVSGRHERPAHQKEDKGGLLELLADLTSPLSPRSDLPIAPALDETSVLQPAQMLAELLSQLLVLMGIGEEDAHFP